MFNKKILIVSNDALSQSGSNGRTLMNLLVDIPKDCKAQFYIHGEPDANACASYYVNTDRDALNTFLFRKKEAKKENDKTRSEKKVTRNLRNLIFRNVAWMCFRWWDKEFDNFLNSFNPDIVLLQAGDSPFMYAIARKISKKFNSKLIMFNTESYVLKKYIYNSVKKNTFWHSIYMNMLKSQYKCFMESSDFCIYNMEELEEKYQEAYPHPGKSCTIYTASELQSLPDNSGDGFSLLYCGNLGVGRHVPLDLMAKALYEVDPNAIIDIYGKFANKENEDFVCKNKNVRFHGFVDYSELPSLMSKASMLIHCENNERLENLRYAFSTKIADSLASGRPFLVYATREYPFVKYLENNNCAHIASDYEELKDVLKKCVDSREYRYKYTENAKATALKNHNSEENVKIMENIIGRL